VSDETSDSSRRSKSRHKKKGSRHSTTSTETNESSTSTSTTHDAPRRRKSRTHDDADGSSAHSSNSKLPATAFNTIARTDMTAMVESMRRAQARPAAAPPSLQSMFAPPPGLSLVSPRTPAGNGGAAAVPSLQAFKAAHHDDDRDDEDDEDDDDEDDSSGEDAPIQLSAAASTTLKDYSHSAMRLPPAPTPVASDAPSPKAVPITLPPPDHCSDATCALAQTTLVVE
jgi:hypothetical protein